MDRILFFSVCISNTLLYTLIKYFHIKFKDYSTLEIMNYANIVELIFMIPFLVYKFRDILKLFVANLRISIVVLASALKIYAIQNISPRNAMVVSFMQPVFIVLLSFMTLGEFVKKDIPKYCLVLFSFLGVFVFVGVEQFNNHGFIYFLLIIHVLLKAFYHIYIKQLSHNPYITWFYGVFFYGIFGIFVLYNNFHYEMLFKKEIIFLGFLASWGQIFLIQSYRLTKKINLLQNIDYSRLVLSVFWTWLIFDEEILLRQVFGIGIIAFSIYLSNAKSFNKS
jgi:drug/metabolite transporter (DMT)-like permease